MKPQQSELVELLDYYPECFSDVMGFSNVISHTITLNEDFKKPKRLPVYRVPKRLKPKMFGIVPQFRIRWLMCCWWRGIVVRPPVLPVCFPYPCARLTAGRVTTLWVKRPLSVSQQGRLSLPSLRGR